MQTIKWLTFGLSNAVTQTCVHFFPAADSVTAPYPAFCSLSLFGQNLPTQKTVTLEGGRLGNPDGIRVKDAFPALAAESVGVFGLEVEISCAQPRIDVSGSGCVIEFISQGFVTRFWPKQRAVTQDSNRSIKVRSSQSVDIISKRAASPRVGVCLSDPYNSSCLVVVNSSERPVAAWLDLSSGCVIGNMSQKDGSRVPEAARLEIPARAVVEFPIADAVYEGGTRQECSWGLLKARVLQVGFDVTELKGRTSDEASPGGVAGVETAMLDDALAAFLVYRDLDSGRIVSVVAL